MSRIVTDQEDFKAKVALAGDQLVVVDFFATWCGPCKMIAPKLEELAQEYFGKLVVLKVDVDQNEELAAEYNISSMPTFLFLKNGAVVNTFAGANYDKLRSSIIELTN